MKKPFLTRKQLKEELEDFTESFAEYGKRYAPARMIRVTSFVLHELIDSGLVIGDEYTGYRPANWSKK